MQSARSSRALVALVAASVSLLVSCGRRDATPPISVETAPPVGAAPPAGALDKPRRATPVDPARTTLTVTFDRAMDREGWAWVIENPATAPEIGTSSWDAAVRINTVHVRLQPGRSYVVWVNSPQFGYFRDPQGATAPPVRWTFSTAGGPGRAPAPIAPLAAHASAAGEGPPRVLALVPANGSTDVDPRLTELRVTFDRPMVDGWSWVRESPESFPPTAGEAFLTPDGRAAALPVRLEPGRSYVVWLNSEQHRDFRDRRGVELSPVRWTFTTRQTR